MSKTAVLRVCASCEWVFKSTEHEDCPECGFAHYGARYVYGDRAYVYARTQGPWLIKQVASLQYYAQTRMEGGG